METNVIYRWAREDEYQKVIELANHSFDEKNHTGDFEKDTDLNSFFPACLPKLYQNKDTATWHYLAIKDDLFVGNVALFQLPTSVFGNRLNVGGIGTVCTRPGHRREGFMLQMMHDVIEEAKRQGKDYLVLGGQRQRYEHWGFECAGYNPVFYYNEDSLRKVFSADASFGYTFQEIKETDVEWILRERVLRLSDGISQVRPEDLEWKALFSMFHTPFAILKDGRFVGSFLLPKGDSDTAEVPDFRLLFEEPAIEIINDLMKFLAREKNKKVLKIYDIAPEHTALLSKLYKTADFVQINPSEMIKILNYERTIKAYLEYKASFTDLVDGEVVLSFDNGELVKIKVENNKVNVYPAMFEDADIHLSELDAVNLLFGVGSFFTNFGTPLKSNVKSWFPLPFFMAMTDEV